MKQYLLIFTILIFVACEKDKESIDISEIKKYVIIDTSLDGSDVNNMIQDTVLYYFNENNKMNKISLNYSLVNGKISLKSKDTVEYIYNTKSNHLYMSIDWTEYGFDYVWITNGDADEWVVLELNSDTLIVDKYSNQGRRSKKGQCGFSVLERK
jgi:hypothetical protein